jgi:ribosomal protein L37AE/L43A
VKHRCPNCENETTYQAFSGGREWYCEHCEETGSYPEGAAPRRAGLLQTEAGRTALRAEMDQELARRRDET